METAHKPFHFRVERRAAEDNLFKTASERFYHGIADLLENNLIHNRNPHKHLIAVHNRLNLILINLLYYQRHRNDNIRVYLRECLHYHLRTRCTGKEMYMRADGHLKEKLEHHTIHVSRRQHGHDFGFACHLRLRYRPRKVDIAP